MRLIRDPEDSFDGYRSLGLREYIPERADRAGKLGSAHVAGYARSCATLSGKGRTGTGTHEELRELSIDLDIADIESVRRLLLL